MGTGPQKILVFISALVVASHAFAAIKYPYVSSAVGRISGRHNNSNGSIKQGDSLRGTPVVVKTDKDSQVRIEMDEESAVIVLANSEIELPFVPADSGEVSEIVVVRGEARFQFQGTIQRTVMTKISKSSFANVDVLVSYNAKVAKAEVTVLRNSVDFGGLNAETVARVGVGEQASFQGVIEDGKVVFDTLLQGKKVARGQLSAVKPVATGELANLTAVSTIKKPPPPKPKAKPQPQPGQICSEPFAKLDECVWRPQGDQCLRQRCNANGAWGDDFLAPTAASACEAKAHVGDCGY